MSLRVIENELVPVYETDIGEKVVYGSELHEKLEVRTKYADWVMRRLSECDAEENQDYQVCFSNLGSENHGGQNKKEYIIKLDTAKEMAMLERNERGKQVRKYFIEVEKRYKNNQLQLSELSPELQMFHRIFQTVATQEIEQKRQAEQLKRLEQKQEAIADTFQKINDTEDFQRWANSCIAKIAESPNFNQGISRSQKYSLARTESYERLKLKRNCRLDDRVQKAIGRALEERPDIKKSELQKINKIYIIANDKDLKPAYELVLKEMMICYCVKTA